MKFEEMGLDGVVLVKFDVSADDRGWFFESYNRRAFAKTGIDASFVQDNQAQSEAGVVRGLHFQQPNSQGKLVSVITGAIYDVAVDIRRSSANFGKWIGVELSASTQQALWVPPGFAHGYQALGEGASVLYKVTNFWSPADEHTICWDDPALSISWPLPCTSISAKDQTAKTLADQSTLPP